MLELRRIVKDYKTGASSVRALDGISLQFRPSEFVSILGPSGCGKTTLLNIVGGLDQYTQGDLIINGISTKKYTDSDWDTYRNHSIGFIFQSYNLIPHQTVLANVELALTLSGVSPKERKARAAAALREVGLGSQLNKKPNQLSGGQMQRVAIARALVNNPDILLADEPTGALDTQTSVQIMEILRKISKKKLIIMVTHNPELAQEYSSRIISVLDGRVVGDTNPYYGGEEPSLSPAKKPAKKRRFRNIFGVTPEEMDALRSSGKGENGVRKGKKSMSFFTALSLSLNNLMTKKGRTFMTSFAGSIGIIGIALILSVSTGVNNYINSIQRDTLASYPIQLQAESTNLSALITSMMQTNTGTDTDRPLDKVYESAIIVELMNSLNNAETESNDLTSFKKYLESNKAFDKYLTAIQYQYDFDWSILTRDAANAVIKSDVMELFNMIYGGSFSGDAMQGSSSSNSIFSSSTSMMTSTFDVWQELLPGKNGESVNQLIKDEYDLIYGDWPKEPNEIMLVVNRNNEISDLSLYALGLRTEAEIMDALMAAAKGETIDTSKLGSWSYEELCKMEFRMLLQSECYQKQADGTFTDMSKTDTGLDYLYNNKNLGLDLKIVGILRPSAEASSAILNGTLVYTSALTDIAIEKTAKSELLKAQIASPFTDVLTGLPFKTDDVAELTNEQKMEKVKEYVASLSQMEKLAIFSELYSTPMEEQIKEVVTLRLSQIPDVKPIVIAAMMAQYNLDQETATTYVNGMDAEMLKTAAFAALSAQYAMEYKAEKQAELSQMTPDQIMAMMDSMLQAMTPEQYGMLYDTVVPNQYSESTYEKNLILLGNVSKESPSVINLYCATFEDKGYVENLIKEYNNGVDEEKKISWTDYVALLMSSVTTIVDAITYVLIAFVAISLVVSSIMIGIITYISVLERTKEIGILRAIGASKKDISRVFNAETLIVGFVAGMIGILITLGLNVVINIILFNLTGIPNLKASLPVVGAVVLVVISMLLTFIAGLFPAGFAAKRNPVEALRSE